MWFMGPGEPHKPVFSEYQNFDDFGKVGIDGKQILVTFGIFCQNTNFPS